MLGRERGGRYPSQSRGDTRRVDDLFEEPQCFDGMQMALLHDKGNQVAATLAAVTTPDTLLQAHREGRCPLLMEGAESPPLPAALLERRSQGLDCIDDVGTAHSIESIPKVLLADKC